MGTYPWHWGAVGRIEKYSIVSGLSFYLGFGEVEVVGHIVLVNTLRILVMNWPSRTWPLRFEFVDVFWGVAVEFLVAGEGGDVGGGDAFGPFEGGGLIWHWSSRCGLHQGRRMPPNSGRSGPSRSRARVRAPGPRPRSETLVGKLLVFSCQSSFPDQ